MLQSVRTALGTLARKHRAAIALLATPAALLFYPICKLGECLYRLGATRYGLKRFKRVGSNVRFDSLGGHIRYEGLQVGSNTSLGAGARIWALSSVQIGNDVMFGPEVYIMDGYHRIDIVGKTTMNSGADDRRPVIIDDDVWVGTRSTILKGVHIAQGSVIGAESLVTKDIPPYVVAGGNPCRILRKRFTDADLAEHLRLLNVEPARARHLIHERATALREACGCASCSAPDTEVVPAMESEGDGFR